MAIIVAAVVVSLGMFFFGIFVGRTLSRKGDRIALRNTMIGMRDRD